MDNMSKALAAMSLDELRAHSAEVEAAIASAQAKAKEDTRSKLQQIASAAGFDLDELLPHNKRGRGKAKKVAATPSRKWPPSDKFYKNPSDPTSKLWTGRGKKPNWLVERLARGAKLEDFRVSA